MLIQQAIDVPHLIGPQVVSGDHREDPAPERVLFDHPTQPLLGRLAGWDAAADWPVSGVNELGGSRQ